MDYQTFKSESVGAAAPILVLLRITGAMLIGIGLVTMSATSLPCGGVLFRGPSFVIELLVNLVT